jgi:hypothetical protein
MATTADDIIRRARSLLQDNTVPYRYSELDLVDAINDALDRVVFLRSDLFITEEFAPTHVTAGASILNIPTLVVYPMTLFVVGYMMLREDEYSEDGRAVALLGAASNLLTERPGA